MISRRKTHFKMIKIQFSNVFLLLLMEGGDGQSGDVFSSHVFKILWPLVTSSRLILSNQNENFSIIRLTNKENDDA